MTARPLTRPRTGQTPTAPVRSTTHAPQRPLQQASAVATSRGKTPDPGMLEYQSWMQQLHTGRA